VEAFLCAGVTHRIGHRHIKSVVEAGGQVCGVEDHGLLLGQREQRGQLPAADVDVGRQVDEFEIALRSLVEVAGVEVEPDGRVVVRVAR